MNRDLSRSRAILIGNTVYRDPAIPDLPQAARCVSAMRELLTSDLCGWPAQRVETLVDAAVPSDVARRVVDAARGVPDVLLLYYVGHGLRTSAGQLALGLRDTDADPEKLPDTATLYEAVARMLRGSPAATKLVILDCCHAELGNKDHFQFQAADIDAEPVDGLYFIGASKRNEKAKAPVGGRLTYFTEAFLDVIRSGIPNRPAHLRLDQIFVELRSRLLRANLPEPVQSGIRNAHLYPFARNAAPPQLHYDPHEEIARLRQHLVEAGAREKAAKDTAAAAERRLHRLREEFDRAATAATLAPQEADLREAQSQLDRATLAQRAARAEWNQVTDALTHTIATTHDTRLAPARRYRYPRSSAAAAAAAGQETREIPGQRPPVDGTSGRRPAAGRVGLGPSRRRVLAGATTAGLAALGATAWAVRPKSPKSLLLTGHTAEVTSVAFGPDRNVLASGSADQTVRLWHVADPARPGPIGQPLTGHTDWVTSVVFRFDGNLLASTGNDETIRLWKVDDPAHPAPVGQPLSGHDNWITSVAFSPDGRTIASGSGDNTIRLWDVADPSRPGPIGRPLTGHSGSVTSVAFRPDGRVLASASYDDTIRLWDVTDPAAPKPIGRPVTGHSDFVTSVAFRPDRRTLASASYDKTVRLWDVTDPTRPGQIGQPLTGHTDWVSSVAFRPDGRMLASGGDHTVRLWDVADPARPGQIGEPLTGHTDWVTSVAFSADGHALAGGGADATIRLWAV
jgi:hypothetical protein